jgi:hypothetical protein
MAWSPNNKAHTCLSGFEIWHHKQKNISFQDSGEWSTNFLIKAALGESPQVRSKKVQAHAKLLDQVFRSLFGARPEAALTDRQVLEKMIAVLTDGSQTMKDLGDAVDAGFRFLGEA